MMASFFRRKRGFIFKIILAVPVIWFSTIGFIVVMSGSNADHNLDSRFPRESDHHLKKEGDLTFKRTTGAVAQNVDNLDPFKQKYLNDQGGGDHQPVIEQPNNDRLRLLERMREDAARELREKELVRHQVKGEENVEKAMKASVSPLNPFHDHVLQEKIKNGDVAAKVPADPNAPGELGRAVVIDKNKLTPDERRKYDQGWQKNAFNQYASDMISLHRSLPDVRDPECKALNYPQKLPDTSVVIIFHNEAWSVLLRTVYSVYDRSPPHLLREIILVDDFSDLDHLQQKLQDFVDGNEKFKLVRAKKREGLIRARLLGASVARGDTITFLDSHCEAAEGWIEPLLASISANTSNVVTPIIDVIDDDSLRYVFGSAKQTSIGGFDWNLQFNWHGLPEHEKERRISDTDPIRYNRASGWLEPLLDRIGTDDSNVVCPVIDVLEDETLRYVHHNGANSVQIGGFDWNLQYNWHPVPEREKRRRSSPVGAIRSPTMAGGLFTISKAYFEKLGTYDPGMDIWGGENLELSFRIWMCGGTLEIVPCSHVGHIFRKRSPYSWKTGVNVVKKNSVRLAEVWMDEYKNYYYERFNFDLGEYGDVTARKQLRKDLKCKSFDWYIRNIYPELFIPGDAVASGEVRNKHIVRALGQQCLDSSVERAQKGLAVKSWPCHKLGGNQIRNKALPQCLDSSVDHHSYNKAIKMWPCHNQGGNQYWMFSVSGEIRRDEGCMDYAGQFVMIYPCHGMKGNQEWVYGTDNTLRHKNTNLCMELSEDGKKVDMKPCTGIDRQIWTWKRKTPKISENQHR